MENKASSKCIAKWQKRLDKAVKDEAKYGKYYPNSYRLEIKIYSQIIKDLTRLKPNTP